MSKIIHALEQEQMKQNPSSTHLVTVVVQVRVRR